MIKYIRTNILPMRLYKIFTSGKPRPARAQLTPANFSLRTSATGDTNFGCGKMQVLQNGQV